MFLGTAAPSGREAAPLRHLEFDPQLLLAERPDGWFLRLTSDAVWGRERTRKLVTTGLLGRAVVPGLPFEAADRSELRVNTDFLGRRRNPANPFPGPLERAASGPMEIAVWKARPQPNPVPRHSSGF